MSSIFSSVENQYKQSKLKLTKTNAFCGYTQYIIYCALDNTTNL